MRAKPKSLALTKFQQAGLATIEQNRSKKEGKKDKGIDIIQVGSLTSAAFLLLWVIAATVVAAVFTVRYVGIVEEDQAWYLQGSARAAAAEAQAVLGAVLEAKQALIASIQYGLVRSGFDYAAIESTLVPTMLLQPYLHSFEMVFTDRRMGLRITHQEQEGTRQLVLQSNGADCYLLGTQGCADLGVPPETFPAWQTEATFLNLSFEGADDEIISQQQMFEMSKQAGPAEAWLTPPALSRGNGPVATWFPVVRLLFRHPLPEAWSTAKEILCGRISLEVATLSGDRLRDAHLGEAGRSYVVDAFGTVLSALHIEDTLTVDSVGNLQLRRITELAEWSQSIAPAFKGDRIEALQVQQGTLAAVVRPLPEPLELFAVVVVSRAENTSFQDSSIVESMSVLLAFASLPYFGVIITLSSVFIGANSRTEFKARKSVFQRFAGGVTDFAAASGAKMGHRSTVRRRTSADGDEPLFDEAMAGAGRKVSHGSIVSAGEIYDEYGKPLAVQPRKTHMLNDAYFSTNKSFKARCARVVRLLFFCCKGRQRE